MTVHSYNAEVAARCGVNAAVVLEQLSALSKGQEVHEQGGHMWVTVSVRDLAQDYPEFTVPQLRHALKRLEDNGLILAEINNLDPYNRTKSYTITDLANAYLTERSDTE